jgi:uncharacterized membrane protein YqaE (UPF0057 family)
VSAQPSILAIVLSVLIPPIGVWMVRGIGPAFWVSLLLTLFGWAPGAVFSLVAVCTPGLLPNRRI